MADYRRKEYRGSLLLVQECGPVDIVVDTDAKTVTPSLAKADSTYSVAGGGASLEYVIPEQTVTTESYPDLGNVGAILDSELEDVNETIIVKLNNDIYALPKVAGAVGWGVVNGQVPDLSFYPLFIAKVGNDMALFTRTSGTYTITAIKAPF